MGCLLNLSTFRQILLLFALCLQYFSLGIITVFPSVLNPVILAPDSDIRVTSDQASWITASLGISGMLGYGIIPPIFEIFGRKAANLTTNLTLLTGCIICSLANDFSSLIIGRLVQGFSIPGSITFNFALCECTSPKRRGYFMVLNKVSVGLGALTCHTLRFVMSWRQIAIFSAIPPFLSAIICVIIAESPSFYAFRGKFEKCTKAFVWYRGDNLNAKKELHELVTAQTENFRMKQRQKSLSVWIKIRNMLLSNDFRKSFYIVLLVKLCLDWSGRYFLLVYITDILVEITKNKSLAMHLAVVSDLILVFSLITSCFLVKRFNRRSLIFNLGFLSAFLMFLVSLSLVLGNKWNLLRHVQWLTPTVIFIHMFITNIGLVPLAFALTGEVFCLEHKGVGLVLTGVLFLGFYTLIMKLTPVIIITSGVEGVYSIFGLCLLICLGLLRCFLLETKDKTLQQIENELKEITRNKSETQPFSTVDVNL